VSTYSPKEKDITHAWHVVDAEGLVLGRLATEVARILRGKHKTMFAPHLDTGDNVIVVNAEKIVLTANKLEKKISYRHSGYPGGLKETKFGALMEKAPEEVVAKAIRGMLPHGPLGSQMGRKLHVYRGATHPHSAQNPQELKIEHARRMSA